MYEGRIQDGLTTMEGNRLSVDETEKGLGICIYHKI